MNESMKKNEYVEQAIDSGIAPLELNFYPIVTCDNNEIIAYKTKTNIRSIMLGVLDEDEYTKVTDKLDLGIEVIKHNLQHVVSSIKGLQKLEKNIDFISLRAYPNVIEKNDLYEITSKILEKNPTVNPKKICFEFPVELVEMEKTKVLKTILDLKVLNVRTMISNVGNEDFPMNKLLSIAPDMVMLSKDIVKWAGSRNKPKLVPSLIDYLISMGIDVYGFGLEKERKALRTSDLKGFLVEDITPLNFKDVINIKEEE